MTGAHGYFLTTTEAARLVAVAPATIRSWVHRGTLQPVRLDDGRLWFTAHAVVDAEYANRRGRGARTREGARDG